MKTQLPIMTEQEPEGQQEHRVLQFRPRPRARPPQQRHDFVAPQDDDRREANDLSRYEQDRPAQDDFHHRMLANTAAFVLPAALIATGIWLVISTPSIRYTQG